MGNNDTNFKPAQIYKTLHGKVKSIAVLNEIRMKILVSEIIAKMFKEHEDEIDQIIKEIKVRKS